MPQSGNGATFGGANIVRAFFEARQAHDLASAKALLTEDAEMWVLGSTRMSGTRRGRDEIVRMQFSRTDAMTVPGTLSIEMLRLVAEEPWVAAEWILRRRTTAGKDYENRFAGFFNIRGGRISNIREYFDTEYVTANLPGPRPE